MNNQTKMSVRDKAIAQRVAEINDILSTGDYTVTYLKAVQAAIRLHHEFVDSGSHFDLARIKQSIDWERKANRQYPARCTAGCKSELHGKSILLGKISKILASSRLESTK